MPKSGNKAAPLFGVNHWPVCHGIWVLLGFLAVAHVLAQSTSLETAASSINSASSSEPTLAERKLKIQGYLREAFAAGYLSARELTEIKRSLDSQKGEKQAELLEMLETFAEVQKRLVEQFLTWWGDKREDYLGPSAKRVSPSANPLAAAVTIIAKPLGLWTGPTAFKLAEMGRAQNPSVSVSNIMFIQAGRMERRVIPPFWRIVYQDRTATWGSFEVKFRDGKVESSGKPGTLLEKFGGKQALPQGRLNVDSDQALFIATTNMPAELKISSSSFNLNSRSGAPVWIIKLWAYRPRHPSEEGELGEIIIATDDGAVLRNDLRSERVQ